MVNEFTPKPTSIKPAVTGTIANADDYNKNIAGQSKDTILPIDEDGNFADGDLGDETEGSVGALISDLKLRNTAQITTYDAFGVLDETVNFGQATESVKGTAELATQAETDAGTDDLRIVTPLKLKAPTATFTISNDATVDFTDIFLVGFNYKIELINIQSVTNAVSLEFRLRTGTTFQTTNYNGSLSRHSTMDNITSTGTGTISLRVVDNSGGFGMSNVSTKGYSGRIWLSNPASTTVHKQMDQQGSYDNQAGNYSSISGAGSYEGSTLAVNGIQFFVSSGNLSSGVINIFSRPI